MSRQGGLNIPTEEWLHKCRKMEVIFCTYHFLCPDSLSREPNVVKNVVALIVARPGAVDARIVQGWVKLRTLIRMGVLNLARRHVKEVNKLRDKTKKSKFAN